MQLENVTAKIRSRSRWEAIDMGCVMARRRYGAILLAWLLTVVPMWVIGIVGFGMITDGGAHLFWSVVWCWLTLGVADRVPLYLMSRELFGEKVSVVQVVRLWWTGMMYRGFFKALISRLSFSRMLSLPVSELEGLKGAAYKARVRLLSRNGGDGATQASMVSLLLVAVTVVGFYLMIMMVLQFYGESEVLNMFSDDVERFGDEYAGWWLLFLFYLMSVMLIEPFFVGAGFAMYINSRTVTEGWDIELCFKRMSERLKILVSGKVVKVMLIGIATAMLGIGNGMAALKAKVPNDPRVEKILKSDDFDVHHKTYEERDKSPGPKSPHITTGNASLFQGGMIVLFYCLLALVVGVIVWFIYQNRHAFKKGGDVVEDEDVPKVKSVMGMDVTPESLPLEVHEEARQAWLRGEYHLALSLLYRGAISWMVHHGRVAILESDTEGDCVRRVEEKRLQTGEYFRQLTQIWVGQAYGDQLPSDDVVMRICDQWPFGRKVGGV